MNKNKVIFGVLGIISLLLIISIFSFSISPTTTSQSIDYHGSVCVYKNGELVDCNDNVLYNSGANLTRDSLGIGSNGAVLNISLCNATAGCGTPVAAASETFNEYTTCGLAEIAGSYSNLGQTGNWTVSHTFTASCDNLEVNVTRLGNDTGTNFAGNSFTLVTMQTNDQLTINWSISVS